MMAVPAPQSRAALPASVCSDAVVEHEAVPHQRGTGVRVRHDHPVAAHRGHRYGDRGGGCAALAVGGLDGQRVGSGGVAEERPGHADLPCGRGHGEDAVRVARRNRIGHRAAFGVGRRDPAHLRPRGRARVHAEGVGRSRERGRQVVAAVGQPQRRQVVGGHVSQRHRDAAGERVARQPQRHQVGQPAELRGYLPGQRVAAQVEVGELEQASQLGRDGCRSVPRREGAAWSRVWTCPR